MDTKKKVLVICSSASGRLSLGVLLNRVWYEPILTKTVFEAMRLLEQEPVSLVMLDGDTPESDRTNAISLLKKVTATRGIPLIIILSAVDETLSARLLSEGCAAVITKPVDISLAYGILGSLSGGERKSPRAPARIRVKIEEQTPAPALFSINISEGGMYLRTADLLPEDTVLHLSFSLPHDQEEISVAGKVVRKTPLGIKLEEEPGIGINFVNVSEDARNRIRNFVTWALSSDIEWETNI